MEFYLRFWSVLSTDLVLVLNSAFVSEIKSCSQRLGIITLSFKMATVLTSLTGSQSACWMLTIKLLLVLFFLVFSKSFTSPLLGVTLVVCLVISLVRCCWLLFLVWNVSRLVFHFRLPLFLSSLLLCSSLPSLCPSVGCSRSHCLDRWRPSHSHLVSYSAYQHSVLD